jgi:hypothetical protein
VTRSRVDQKRAAVAPHGGAVGQTILWTALPNGISSGHYQLSVLISPRLTGGSPLTLGDFADWLNWPKNVPALTVSINGGPPIPSTIRPGAPALREDLWTKLFTGSTPVESYATADRSATRVRSYPVSPVRQ